MLNKAIGFANDLLLSFTFLVSVASGSLSSEDCLQLGFRRSDLQCAWCDKLNQFNLDVLKENCSQCCSITAAKEPVKVSYEGESTIKNAFVKGNYPKEFPGLSIKYVRGADPIIHLLDEDGNSQEELSIQRWDTDTVVEFLREHLEE